MDHLFKGTDVQKQHVSLQTFSSFTFLNLVFEQLIPQFHSHWCAYETVRSQIFWVAISWSPHEIFFYQGGFALLLKAEHGDKQNRNVITESGFEKNLPVSLVLSKKQCKISLKSLAVTAHHISERIYEQLHF